MFLKIDGTIYGIDAIDTGTDCIDCRFFDGEYSPRMMANGVFFSHQPLEMSLCRNFTLLNIVFNATINTKIINIYL